MKKLLILPAAAMLLGLGVAAGVSKAPVVEVKADSVSTATVDITGKTWLKASEGTMVSVPNWKTSGLGVSFEVKYSNPTSIANNTVFNFFSGSTKISGNIYLADFGAATKDSVNNLIKARDSYHRVAVVDAAEGWIRYDILFKDAPAIAGQESATVDAINFIWYGNPFVQMRNLQVISDFRYIGDTPVAYNKTNTAGYLKGGYDEFPKIANWSTSGLGFSLEFKPTEEKDTLISLLDNSYAAVASGNDYMYRKNNSGNPSKGKIFALANGWYRYEAMLSEFGVVAGKEAETLTMINLVKWEASGYNCKPEYRNVKVI
ncbi:MAG: hypothetical protein MJ248_06055, partial [Bacilli bacterium]|nr:hypothetical protein [Bacilli bacterium]